MANSSLKSDFSFLSYKVDKLEMSILQDIGVIKFDCNYDNFEWNQSISIRKPIYFESIKVYLCGISSVVTLKPKKQKNKRTKAWLRLRIGMVGLFSVEDRIDEALERKFVSISAPAILFPFLRATCANLLASAGFGSVVMPLINMYKVGISVSSKENFAIAVKP